MCHGLLGHPVLFVSDCISSHLCLFHLHHFQLPLLLLYLVQQLLGRDSQIVKHYS
jgi:hypothetical protein